MKHRMAPRLLWLSWIFLLGATGNSIQGFTVQPATLLITGGSAAPDAAIVFCAITSNGGSNPWERGVVYASTENPTIVTGIKVVSLASTHEYNVMIMGLVPGANYYVRAYAINSAGVAYSDQMLITTPMNPVTRPVVHTGPVSEVLAHFATVGGGVVEEGVGGVYERGIVYATRPDPTLADTVIKAGSGKGLYSVQLAGLFPETTYYARAYASNHYTTAYGNQIEFTTAYSSIRPATVLTTEAKNVEAFRATLGGTITDSSNTLMERGIVFASHANPSIDEDIRIPVEYGTGGFSINISGLSMNTTYYARAYAINAAGPAYGIAVEFHTPESAITPPMVTTMLIDHSDRYAAVGGHVDTAGGDPAGERGILFGTTNQLLIENATRIRSGRGDGQFVAILDGLHPETRYFARAYAINSAGVGYGKHTSLTTEAYRSQPSQPFAVTLSSGFAYGGTNALIDCVILDKGNSGIRQRGVVYGESSYPMPGVSGAIAVNKIGSGIGPFSIILSGLEPHTTYYARVFVENIHRHTYYGNSVRFTTAARAQMSPQVQTMQVTDISSASARVRGRLTRKGDGPVIECGVLVGRTREPTIDDATRMAVAAEADEFVADLNGLIPATSYYARAYAVNNAGCAYGAVLQFTTQASQPRGLIKAIATGRFHTLFVTRDGGLWTMGHNEAGQLGDGSTNQREYPQRIADSVIAVAARNSQSFFIMGNGALWGMGLNEYHQMGDGTSHNRLRPVRIAEQVQTVASGDMHTHFVKHDGTLWGMGYNTDGRLGDWATSHRQVPSLINADVQFVATSLDGSYFIRNDGGLWATGHPEITIKGSPPVKIVDNVRTVAAGYRFILFTDNEDKLWGRGYNQRGQLGDGTTQNRASPNHVADNVRSVVAGSAHALFIGHDNRLWAIGSNENGQLADGSNTDQHSPVLIADDAILVATSDYQTCFVRTDGTLWRSRTDGPPECIVYPLAFKPDDELGHIRHVTWFGWYNARHWPWLFDLHSHNWLRVIDNGPEDVWFWSATDGQWTWTRSDIYPWLFNPATGEWND